MAPVHVTFRGWRCRVERASYGGTDRIALPLTHVEDGSPVATTTVIMPELHLAADEVLRTTARTRACSPCSSAPAWSARPSARCSCAT